MSIPTALALLAYIAISIYLARTCGRRGIVFALALVPLALANELIRRHFGENWCLVLLVPILLLGYFIQRPRNHKKDIRP
jgi:hypothetical protein